MSSSLYNLVLHFVVQGNEKGAVAGNSDQEIAMALWMFLSVQKGFPVHNVKLNMLTPILEIGFDEGNQFLQVRYGFGPPFIGTILLYSLSVILYWTFFLRGKAQATDPIPILGD